MSWPEDLWPPQRRALDQIMAIFAEGKDACLYSPTGGGKTRIAAELAKHCLTMGLTSAFYVNRRLLIGQTIRQFQSRNLEVGVVAAGYQDLLNRGRAIQIVSTLTEWARCYKRSQSSQTLADVIVVDEAHLQKAIVMRQILKDHRKRGARILLMTATPIGLSKLVDTLIRPGTLAEYRECKALVPAMVHSIEQPDLRKVKRNRVGEYVLNEKRIQVYVQAIVGNVLRSYEEYNPDRRPALLYAPCVKSSVWLTEQFNARGHAWCHVDARDAVLDGQRVALDRTVWETIVARYQAGEIKGISSRFKLREGIDLPDTYHCILATPMGSVASYLQTTGRILRYSAKTPDHVIITDHGGNYWRHGSPNHDRDWETWWNVSENVASTWYHKQIQEGHLQEPIRCPECALERTTGITCPGCGHTSPKSKRWVLQEQGNLVAREGKLLRQKLIKLKHDTQQLWDRMFWSAMKYTNQTFTQIEGYFFYTHHYYPPRTLLHMPLEVRDWYRHVRDVEKTAIRWPERQATAGSS